MKRLPLKTKQCLTKATDTALCAIEIYNKPSVKFKSSNYVCLMIMAWQSLFHSYFFSKKIKPYYRKKNGVHFERKEDDYMWWELSTCIKEYYKSDTQNPVRKNLEFFIPLRNKIEHKYLPELDSTIFGECQSLLFNFDDFIVKEFGDRYTIKESLSFALQLYHDSGHHTKAILHNSDYLSISNFIDNYRSSISNDVYSTGKYSFKAFLIQTTNNQRNDSIPIKFYKWDKLSDEDKKRVNKYSAVMTREKKILTPTIIHSEQILNAYLRNIELNAHDSELYIEAACYETSKYLPLRYFIKKIGKTISEIIDIINKSKSTRNTQKENLIELLTDCKAEDFKLGRIDTGTESALVIISILSNFKNKSITLENYSTYDTNKLIQAITHIDSVSDLYPDLKNILLALLDSYKQLKAPTKTNLLKVIYYLDLLENDC